MIVDILDDPHINDRKRTLEERYASCKRKAAASGVKEPYAVCAYLNPKLSSAQRARLRRKMAAARRKK